MQIFLPFVGAILGALLSGILAESYRRHRDRQGIAASIKGEISAILDMTKRRDYVTFYRAAAAALRAGTPTLIPDVLRRPIELDPIMSRLADRIGVLGGEVPDGIVSFYTRLMGIRLDMQRLSDGVWDADLNTKASVIEENLVLWSETENIGQSVCQALSKISHEKWFGVFVA